MLKRIEQFLEERGQAPLAAIATRIGAPESAVLPMLELLERKGRVRRIRMKPQQCAGCTICPPNAREEWALADDTATPAPAAAGLHDAS